MDASDLIKALQNTLQGGGRPHMGNPGLNHGIWKDWQDTRPIWSSKHGSSA